jgi:integrase
MSSNSRRDGTTAIDRAVREYLHSESAQSGAYRKRAESTLREFTAWCKREDYTRLRDLLPDGRHQPLRDYAKFLRDRVRGRAESLLEHGQDEIAGSTARTNYNIVRAMLTYAVEDGRIDTNPAARHNATSELPKDSGSKDDQQHWTPGDVEAIMNVMNERVREASSYSSWEARQEYQERALVSLLAFSAARGAEVLRHPDDERDGRQGLRWSNVHLEDNRMQILRKNGVWMYAQLPRQAVKYLDRHKRVQEPPHEDWPVFPTRHAPSLAARVREELDNAGELLDESTAEAVLRNQGVAPPSLTTEGCRSLLKKLCKEHDIEPESGGNYLEPHGARHGIGTSMYRQSAEMAQKALGHQSPEVTADAYEHIETTETADRVGDVIEEEYDIE